MVSGNGVNSVPRPNYRTYRKMADIGVQYELQDATVEPDLPMVNSTVAEINTSVDINGCVTHAEIDSSPTVTSRPPSLHRPLSVQSSTSTSSSSGEPRRAQDDDDVDAICVQTCAAEDDNPPADNDKKPFDQMEPDRFYVEEKPETSCGIDCVYYTMKCCECTIL